MVGMTGFEPAAPSSRTKCATKLRYIPLLSCQVENFRFQRCATPLLGQYSIVLVGRVLHPAIKFSKLKTFVFNGALPLIPSPENLKLILRFDFLPSPTLMILWARGKDMQSATWIYFILRILLKEL